MYGFKENGFLLHACFFGFIAQSDSTEITFYENILFSQTMGYGRE